MAWSASGRPSTFYIRHSCIRAEARAGLFIRALQLDSRVLATKLEADIYPVET